MCAHLHVQVSGGVSSLALPTPSRHVVLPVSVQVLSSRSPPPAASIFTQPGLLRKTHIFHSHCFFLKPLVRPPARHISILVFQGKHLFSSSIKQCRLQSRLRELNPHLPSTEPSSPLHPRVLMAPPSCRSCGSRSLLALLPHFALVS